MKNNGSSAESADEPEFKYITDDEAIVLGDEKFAVHPVFYEALAIGPLGNLVVEPNAER